MRFKGYQSLSLARCVKVFGLKRGILFWYNDCKLCWRFARLGISIVR